LFIIVSFAHSGLEEQNSQRSRRRHLTGIGTILKNESTNGSHRATLSGCYASNLPAISPEFTKVCISLHGSTIADLKNSLIVEQMTISKDNFLEKHEQRKWCQMSICKI
jgi:hypothetical protein